MEKARRTALITEFEALADALIFWRAALAHAPAAGQALMRDQIARLDARHQELSEEIEELC